MKSKIPVILVLAIAFIFIIACGCSDSSNATAYSSGPTSAGEGQNMKNGQAQPAMTYGSVAGGTGTGAVTSGGSQQGN